MVVSTLTMNEVTEHAGANHIQHRGVGAVVTAILHDQAMAARPFRGFNNIPAVFECIRRRHFGAYMLSLLQCSEHLRHVPLPRCSNINKIEIITRRQPFEVSLTFGVDRRRLLSSLFYQLSCSLTLLFDYIAYRVHNHFIYCQKFTEDAGSAQTDANDSNPDNIARFKLHANHCMLFAATSLIDFRPLWTISAYTKTRRITHARSS